MKYNFLILGGGVAGLTAARELLKRNRSVVVIEKSSEVGGLARTFEKDGFRFDVGGHRFHSNNPAVIRWLKELLASDLRVVPRVSHIHLRNQFISYPLQFPDALTAFPPSTALQMGASYVRSKIAERDRPDNSFEDWVVKRFGQVMYELFFEPYTEKVWGLSCDKISAEWASQRIGVPSMWQALKETISPSDPPRANDISTFYYPRQGFGMIPQALRREISALGGSIRTSSRVTEVIPVEDEFKVTATGPDGSTAHFAGENVISTIPLTYLLQAIPPELGSRQVLEDYQLAYRGLICLFIALEKERVSPDNWTYFPNGRFIFGRTHEPKNWSPEMVPDDSYTSLGVEIFSSREGAAWQFSDEALLTQVIAQLSQIGWIEEDEVHDAWVLRVPHAYPVYRSGYREKLQRVKTYLRQWENLHLVGRTGSFRYMNSDGVVENVFEFISDHFPEEAVDLEPLAYEEGRWV